MDAKKLSLLLSVFVLIALTFGYFSLSKNENAGIEAVFTTPTATDSVYIINNPDAVVKKMIYETPSGITTFVSDDGESWYIEGNEDIPLDNLEVKNLSTIFTNLSYDEKVLDEATNLAEYGLDTPFATITGTTDSGETNNIFVGNETPDKSGYYVMANEDPALYVVNKAKLAGLEYSLNDIIDKSIPSINTTTLQYVEIKVDGLEDIIIEAPTEAAVTSDIPEEYGIVTLNMVAPLSNREVYADVLATNYLSPLLSASLGELVEATPEDLSIYGLSEPTIEVTMNDGTNNYHLLIGFDVPEKEGMVYCKQADKDAVFMLDKAAVQQFYAINIFDFIESFAALEGISTVSEITITGPAETHYITITQEVEPPIEEGGQENIVYFPIVDGVAVQEEAFKTFYTNLIGVTFDKILTSDEATNVDVESGPVITFVYQHIDGSPATQVDFYNYNENFYAVASSDGVGWFAVNKQEVDFVFENMQSLLSGELDEE